MVPAYAVTAELMHTAAGWPPVKTQMAAVNAFAAPSMAWATGLDGSDNACAMSVPDMPANSCGLMLAPDTTKRLSLIHI